MEFLRKRFVEESGVYIYFYYLKRSTDPLVPDWTLAEKAEYPGVLSEDSSQKIPSFIPLLLDDSIFAL